MRAAAVGIMGLGYEGLADCQPKFLNHLLNSVARGVVENSDYQTPKSAWLKILGDMSIADMQKRSLIPSNIPLTTPTAGYPSLDIEKMTLKEELEAVFDKFKMMLGRGTFVASINLYENDRSCEGLNLVDNYLEKMRSVLDSFIFFSPYGGQDGAVKSRYGIYLSTLQRPFEDQTIKLEQIMPLVLNLGRF
ncbi:MAG: hypothetical protein JRN26_05435 [Nitrososphaerota archaeon]|jgi:hypothetical protein|nr:hypothetical protein [Nitrososphaerota archaeon]MDG6928182.1 hypothetical protein [Nitrososphaerota archaeon]MDG6930804.1 hypothetical protein [Nitrososphaerota archaeon]MDG6932971.1 hypothetical protein [Nitrososphaerota archaeon]MDG6936306.1 hypothetical protein [Nitrososphaerota archaeon]